MTFESRYCALYIRELTVRLFMLFYMTYDVLIAHPSSASQDHPDRQCAQPPCVRCRVKAPLYTARPRWCSIRVRPSFQSTAWADAFDLKSGSPLLATSKQSTMGPSRSGQQSHRREPAHYVVRTPRVITYTLARFPVDSSSAHPRLPRLHHHSSNSLTCSGPTPYTLQRLSHRPPRTAAHHLSVYLTALVKDAVNTSASPHIQQRPYHAP